MQEILDKAGISLTRLVIEEREYDEWGYLSRHWFLIAHVIYFDSMEQKILTNARKEFISSLSKNLILVLTAGAIGGEYVFKLAGLNRFIFFGTLLVAVLILLLVGIGLAVDNDNKHKEEKEK